MSERTMNQRITKEEVELMDGSKAMIFTVACGECGKPVFINTVSKNPKHYDYFCIECGAFIEDAILDEIIMEAGL
jgi:DNA-directed RNA polymerase subunit RPC12/RpoP